MGSALSLYSGYWHPHEGGAEQQLRRLSEQWRARGWTVEVTCAVGDSVVESDYRVNPVGTGRGAALFADRSRRPDIVLSSLLSSVSVAGLFTARRLKVPAVLRLGGAGLDIWASSARRRRWARLLVRSCDAIVANAEHLLGPARAIGPRPGTILTVIRNGVPAVSPLRRVSAEGPIRVLYYTNSGPAKNDAALAAVAAATPEVQYRIVGAALPSASPNVEVVGWRDDLSSDFAWADVVVNVSSSEGSPNFCMQALAAGIPVLGFGNAGIMDLKVEYPHDVVVVPMNDTQALAGALRELDWRTWAVQATVPTLDSAAAQWLGLFGEVLAGGVRRHS